MDAVTILVQRVSQIVLRLRGTRVTWHVWYIPEAASDKRKAEECEKITKHVHQSTAKGPA
jgi:hypothetical protein